MSPYRQSVLSVMEMSTSRSSVYILCQCHAWAEPGLTLMCGLKRANRNPADNPTRTQSIKSKWGSVKPRISVRILGIALPSSTMLRTQCAISFRFMALSTFQQYLLLKQKEITFFHWIDSFYTNPEHTDLFKATESRAFALLTKINASGFL